VRTAAAVAALALIASAGCGPSGDLVKSGPPIAQLQAGPELGGTPQRGAVDWWNALRTRDPEAVLARMAPVARRGIALHDLALALRGTFGVVTERSEPTVLYSEREAGRVTVFMRVDSGNLIGSVLVKGGGFMLAVPMTPADGGWLVENGAWLRHEVAKFITDREQRKAAEAGK
jgi:hypothetical protein